MKQCFECEKTADEIEIHDHHVVPRSKGGTKTIPLCFECHALVHDRKAISIGRLVKKAAESRKARGYVATIPPYGFAVEDDGKLVKNKEEDLVAQEVKRMRHSGYTWKRCADYLNERGYYNRSGRLWSLHNLRSIFVKREGYEKRKPLTHTKIFKL